MAIPPFTQPRIGSRLRSFFEHRPDSRRNERQRHRQEFCGIEHFTRIWANCSRDPYFEWDPGTSPVDIQTSVSATGVSQFYADTDGGTYDMSQLVIPTPFPFLDRASSAMVTAGGLQSVHISDIQPTWVRATNLTPGCPGGGGSGHGGYPLGRNFGTQRGRADCP